MTHSTVSLWDVTEWSDEMEAMARDKFVPLIMSVGAERVQMIRTGELSFCVVTEYSSTQAAEAAQERIAEIRGQATDERPMPMANSFTGAVFAHG